MIKYLIALALILTHAGVGYYAHTNAVKRTELRYERIFSDLEQQAESRKKAAQEKIYELEREYLSAQRKLEEKPKEIVKYVPQIQQVDSDCNVPLGVIGVLNQIRGYPHGTAQNPRIPDAEKRTPSTLTEGEALEQWKTCEQAYESERVKRNALIDVVRVIQQDLADQ